MPAIGALDRRITLQRFDRTFDEYNRPIEAWVDVATVRAQRKDVTDGEKYVANTTLATRLTRFIVRASSVTRQTKVTDRIAHDGTTWHVSGIKETRDGRNRFLEITAQAEG